MARRDHNGRGDENEGGRDVVTTRHSQMTNAHRPSPIADREGQTFAHRGSRWLTYVNFVKLPHTLFALPFALVGVVLASYEAPVTLPMVGWTVLAFTCARFAA